MTGDEELGALEGEGGERPEGPEPILERIDLRSFSERPTVRKPRGHGDVSDRVDRLRIVLGSFAGAFLGFATGFFLMVEGGGPGAALYPLVGAVVGFVNCFALISFIVKKSGELAGSIYMPGRSGLGGRRREYSLAESFAAQGRYEDAVSAFEMAVAEHPEDATPYLRIARISRDHLDKPREAIRWLKRARSEASPGAGEDFLALRELVELYRKVGEPTRAAPEVARMAEERAGTPEGDWAAAELEELKRLITGSRGEHTAQ